MTIVYVMVEQSGLAINGTNGTPKKGLAFYHLSLGFLYISNASFSSFVASASSASVIHSIAILSSSASTKSSKDFLSDCL